MNTNEEKKAKLRNFTFVESADNRLLDLTDKTGKTMTAVIEDLLLGRRQFRPDVEDFIAEQVERFKKPRNEIIEAALYVAMKFASGEIPSEKEFSQPKLHLSAEDIKAKAIEGSSHAARLRQESGKKRKVASPSGNKSSRAASGHGNQH